MTNQARTKQARNASAGTAVKTAFAAGSSRDWPNQADSLQPEPDVHGFPRPWTLRRFFVQRGKESGEMPNLTIQQQRELGTTVAKLLAPLPLDERLLLLIACLYGEGRSQGMTSGEVIAFCERICSIHERGVAVQVVRSTACPLCGTPRGAS